MPVQKCKKNGKPGYRWGDEGFCYTYSAGDEASRKKAKQRAYLQGSTYEKILKGILNKLRTSGQPE